MGKKYSWFDTSKEKRDIWEQLCPADQYRVLVPTDVPSIIPRQLLAKACSVLIVGSGSVHGQILYMANILRVDNSASAIDQEPFGIVFQGNAPASSGCLLHHGNWTGRTTYPPPDFWQTLATSGIDQRYPFESLPSSPAGPITDLHVPSQHGAFQALIFKLKDQLKS